jgi:phage-related baseplate assembly protein
VDSDPAKVERNVITTYEAITSKKLYPGDPVRLFLEGLAYLIAQQNYIIDYSAKQNLLAYASGDYLDHLGILTDTQRLPAQAAKTTMQFSISEALGSAVLIPQDIRATPGDQLYFATDKAVEIPAGETSITVSATCQQVGVVGNGFIAGQIDKLVDPVEHVSSVSNTTISLGGTDQESDQNFRERIRLAPEKYSSAGPDLSYEYFARRAHQDISDVSVISPTPGSVDIYVLMQGGELPSPEMLEAVEAETNPKKRRPINDNVNAKSPEQVSYDLEITYYISTADSTRAASIQEAVQKAVNTYLSWQKSALGRDINPSELTRRVQQAGAKRTDITSPTFQFVAASQVASDGTVSIAYGGLEDA